MERRILHVDIDAFLASVEQLRNPVLFGQPVAVGTGVVASRSYEAKQRGVATGMPLQEARRRCPELVVCAGDARLAERYRQRVAELLRERAPVVEVCSLDDFYADLSGLPLPSAAEPMAGLVDYCQQLRAAVRAATGLSVAQGLGSSRTVARLATTRAKPGGICIVPAGQELDFLGEFAVAAIPGIGPATADWLQQLGIVAVRELWALSREQLHQALGARGEEIWARCRGLDTAAVTDSPPLRSISRETSLEPLVDDGQQQREFLAAMLSYLLDRASSELRRRQLRARTLQLRLVFVDGAAAERSRSLPTATERTDRFVELGLLLLDELLQRRALVRLIGVSLASLVASGAEQRLLFDDGNAARQRLFAAVDQVRQRHGFGALVVGGAAGLLGQLPHGKHGFRLRTPSLTK